MVGVVLLWLPRVTELLITSNSLSAAHFALQKLSCSITSHPVVFDNRVGFITIPCSDKTSQGLQNSCWEQRGTHLCRGTGHLCPATLAAAAFTHSFEGAQVSPGISSWGHGTVQFCHPQPRFLAQTEAALQSPGWIRKKETRCCPCACCK